MFLHSGAAIHRHEYSPPLEPRAPASRPRRSTLSRVSFPTTNVPRRSASFDSPTPMPLLQSPGSALAEYVQRTNEPSVRFQEPDPDAMSDDGKSVANSETSGTTAGGPRPRKRSRNSTSYSLAHPAPTLGQKQKIIIVRPRLLLQLQRLSPDSRPKPAIDVLPSTVVVPRVVKKFPRLFRGKGGLGANDVMIVKSEEYGTPDIDETEDTESEDDAFGAREVLAVICQMRKDEGGAQGVAEIVLADGVVWTARPMTNGLYEFNSTDQHGIKTTARWVRRTSQRSSMDFAATKGPNANVKFTFSIIDPSSRRHPIMATITQKKLDIPEFYTSVSPSGKQTPTSPIRTFPGDAEYLDQEPAPERITHFIDQNLKNLITVTGIWVALRQGWSPYFRYEDAMSAMVEPASAKGHNRRRSSSLINPESTGRLSPALMQSARTLSADKIRRRSYGREVPRTPSFNMPSPSQPEQSPKRVTSTGTAFMERVSARKAGQPPSSTASESEGENGTLSMWKGACESVVTTRLTTITSHRHSTPAPSTAPTSLSADQETPGRQRKAISYIAPRSQPKNQASEVPDIEHIPATTNEPQVSQVPSQVEKPKVGKWKAFTRLFRRSKKSGAR
ncbi:hypothetical protein F5884DRAFT_297642 [Xylogone sp. PMI_703]|nr:hypothetical protein F5884DRAFT_297642 [Xylogone sp. PMI_703]